MTSGDSAVALAGGRRQVLSAAGRAVAHPALPLLAIMAVAAVWWGRYAADTRGWSVMTDELQYAELARSIGDSLSLVPSINGEFHGSYNQLYPLLLAPFYALLGGEAAFDAAHLLNTALMVSTAIPAYLLARDIGAGRLAAYLAGALTVAVPWLVVTTMILTESAAYPAFLWAILAVERALARPSPRRDLVAVGALVLAFAARSQFVLLALLLPVALVLHEAGFAAVRADAGSRLVGARAALRRMLWEHRALWIGCGVAALAAAAIALPKGSITEILGSYSETTEGDLVPAGTAEWMAKHLAVVAVAVGVVPFVLAVAWMLTALVRPSSSKAAHAFAVLLLLVVPLMTFQVTSFSLRFSGQIVQDRYLFYIVPLLFVGFAGALVDRRLPVRALGFGAALFALIAWQPDYTRETAGPFFNSPAGVFHSVFDGRAWELGQKLGIVDLRAAPVITVAGVGLALAAWLAIRRLRAPWALGAVGLSMLAFCVAETRYVFGGAGGVQAGPAAGTVHRDWVDRALPAGESAAVLFSPIIEDAFIIQALWWDTVLFNDSIDREFQYQDGNLLYPSQTPFPYRILRVDWESGLIDHDGVDRRYLVYARSDSHLHFRPQAEEVAAIAAELRLVRMAEPWRARWATRGVDRNGVVRDAALLRLYGDERASEALEVRFELAPVDETGLAPRYRVTGGAAAIAGRLDGGRSRHHSTVVCLPARGHVDLDFRLSGRAILRLIETAPASGRCRAGSV